MAKIRICHVTSAHRPFDSRIFSKECISLSKAYDVYLIAPNIDDCERDGIHVIGVSIAQKRFRRQIEKKKILKRMMEVDADVYHFHEPELIMYGLKMKKKGKKVIFDSHEDSPATILDMRYFPVWLRKTGSKVYEWFEKYALKKFDGVISVDPRIVDRLKKINQNTEMITNYPKYEEYNIGWERQNQACFTGNIGRLWCPQSIVQGIYGLDVKLVLAGFSSEEYISENLKVLPAWTQVEYTGLLPHDEALKIQGKSFAAFALLDYGVIVGGNWGTMGNTKIFEYMMTGTPIICTDFILWKKIIDKYQCGICVNPHNIKEIHDAVEYLQNHPEEVKRMGENGRNASREVFNWDTQEKVLLDFYKSTVGV